MQGVISEKSAKTQQMVAPGNEAGGKQARDRRDQNLESEAVVLREPALGVSRAAWWPGTCDSSSLLPVPPPGQQASSPLQPGLGLTCTDARTMGGESSQVWARTSGPACCSPGAMNTQESCAASAYSSGTQSCKPSTSLLTVTACPGFRPLGLLLFRDRFLLSR